MGFWLQLTSYSSGHLFLNTDSSNSPIAALLMATSSITVVINALSLD